MIDFSFLNEADPWQRLAEEGHLCPERVNAAFAEVAEDFANCRVLLVPHLLSDPLVRLCHWPLLGRRISMAAQLGRLCRGAEILRSRTTRSIEENATRIAEHIAQDDGPWLLMSFSKGSLDTMEFLRTANDDLLSRIAGWIPVQAPFGGSPLADFTLAKRWLRWPVAGSLSVTGSNLRLVESLSMAARSQYLSAHAERFEELAERIPVVTLGSCAAPRLSLTNYLPTTWVLNRSGEPHDGVVPLSSSQLPFAQNLVLHGVFHSEYGITRFSHQPQLLLLKAVLALLLQKKTAEAVARIEEPELMPVAEMA